MAGAPVAVPRPPASPRPPRPARQRATPPLVVSPRGDGERSSSISPVDVAGGEQSISSIKDLSLRPNTHCGALQRPAFDEEFGADVPECGAAGAAALESVRGGCRSCHKFRLRLEHEERARVKAQEQLAKLQAEIVRLRRQDLADYAQVAAENCAGAGCEAALKTGAGCTAPGVDEVGHSLETYRREVSILREALEARDARESDLSERLRRQRVEHENEKQEWEGQVAGLVCEVQDLEARNRELEAALRRTITAAASSAMASTAASASAGGPSAPSSEAATASGLEDLPAAL
mmetsp:Transcript_59390/g.173747  ORF Transcript_59390/g.173747 Transcript_59390/m.173747 type:complete len:292 (-) Transcript_59390:91-966(-)